MNAGIVPFHYDLEAMAKDGVMVVGDAAGLDGADDGLLEGPAHVAVLVAGGLAELDLDGAHVLAVAAVAVEVG